MQRTFRLARLARWRAPQLVNESTWPSTKSRRGLGKMEKGVPDCLSFIRQFERRCDMANQLAGTQGRAYDGGVRRCGRVD